MSSQNKVCYTAIFGDYDTLKEPTIISEGWDYICFTDQPIKSPVWKMVTVVPELGYRRSARWYKIMGWIHWKYSMWIDGSFQINCDLNKWWAERFKTPFSCARHPLRTSIYHECRSCIVNNRGDDGRVQAQEERYRSMAFPDHMGIITSGILMRENTPDNIKLHEAWWKELNEQSVRDQIAFAFVSLGLDWVHTYQWDYASKQQRDFIYHKHKHQL